MGTIVTIILAIIGILFLIAIAGYVIVIGIIVGAVWAIYKYRQQIFELIKPVWKYLLVGIKFIFISIGYSIAGYITNAVLKPLSLRIFGVIASTYGIVYFLTKDGRALEDVAMVNKAILVFVIIIFIVLLKRSKENIKFNRISIIQAEFDASYILLFAALIGFYTRINFLQNIFIQKYSNFSIFTLLTFSLFSALTIGELTSKLRENIIKNILDKSKNKNDLIILIKNGMKLDETNCNGLTPLFYAVEIQHIEMVNVIVNQKIDLLKQINGMTILEFALAKNNTEIITIVQKAVDNYDEASRELLELSLKNNAKDFSVLKKNLNLNYKDKNGNTPFLNCCISGNSLLIKELINKKCDIATLNKQMQSCIILASIHDNDEILNILLKVFSGLNLTDINNESAIVHAFENKNNKIIKTLIESNVDLKSLNKKGKSLSYISVENGNLEGVKLLYSAGNIKDSEKYSNNLVLLSCYMNRLDILSYLVSKNHNLNIVNADDENGLFVAINKGHMNLISVFNNENFDINYINKYGETALSLAIKAKNIIILKELYKFNNINFDCLDHEGNSALHLAIIENNKEAVDFLIDLSFKIDLKNYAGENLLHTASKIGNISYIKLLIEKKISTHSKDTKGYIPVMNAIENEHLDCITELMKYPLGINLPCNEGNLVIDIAERTKNSDIIDITTNTFNRFISDSKKLMKAALDNEHWIIRELVKKKVECNVITRDGYSALMFASSNGNFESVKELISGNADICFTNNENINAIDCANMNNHHKIEEFLKSLI